MGKDIIFKKIEKLEHPSTILFRSIELKLLKESLSDDLKRRPALDLGCGEGIVASILFDEKIDYGLDNDRDMIEKANKSDAYKKAILADAGDVPLKNGSLALVFSNSVIEHIKDLDPVLREVSRILTKGGIFVFTAPSDNIKKYSLLSRWKINYLSKVYCRIRNRKFNHYHCYSLKKWEGLLTKKGFRLVKGYYYIKKENVYLWDLFLLIFFLLKPLGSKTTYYIYNRLFRQVIYNRYSTAKKTDPNGAAVCIMAQKV